MDSGPLQSTEQTPQSRDLLAVEFGLGTKVLGKSHRFDLLQVAFMVQLEGPIRGFVNPGSTVFQVGTIFSIL